MFYSNAYQHTDRAGRVWDFCGVLHPSREVVDVAAAYELSIESRTRRVGVWRVKAKGE